MHCHVCQIENTLFCSLSLQTATDVERRVSINVNVTYYIKFVINILLLVYDVIHNKAMAMIGLIFVHLSLNLVFN